MQNPQVADEAPGLRQLPSTDELLKSATAESILREAGRARLTSLARAVIKSMRDSIRNDPASVRIEPEAGSKQTVLANAELELEAAWESYRSSRLRKVINATGVVIHTNLGRAPLSKSAAAAINDATGYCTVEFDLGTGERGRRGAYVERLVTEITGAESALIVNNCAAAALLVLSVLAKGGEVIVSRGELVEIGGDFRIPDVLTESGATLREVGTTNRTKLSDYEKAIGADTKLILRVHPSNYRIVGFTHKPELNELAALARSRGIALYEDAGSGALTDFSKLGFDEPLIASSIGEGADVVTFSGDKLLGGCQAGLIVGSKGLVEQMRRHSMYRALRVDKLVYAALGAALESYLRNDEASEIPVVRMLSLTEGEISVRANRMRDRLISELGGNWTGSVEAIPGESVVGGGAASGITRHTVLIAMSHASISASELGKQLRLASTPVITRIENERVVIDLRTVDEDEENLLVETLVDVLR